MAMKPEFKKVWVDALRSGEFRQGASALRRIDGGYCCLGVACAVWSRLGLVKGAFEQSMPSGSWSFVIPDEESRYGDLPTSIKAAALIDSTTELVSMNDGKGKSFSQIADYIEANL